MDRQPESPEKPDNPERPDFPDNPDYPENPGRRALPNKKCQHTKKCRAPRSSRPEGPGLLKEAATYSPALHCSTIGAGGLNFSVRDGKRWDPAAITT